MKAVLFDLDGTLLDTEESISSAFRYAFDKHKVTHPSKETLRKLMGSHLPDMYRTLAPNYDTEHMLDAHREFQRSNLHLVKPFPHVTETLVKLQEAGYALAVVTSRLRQSMSMYLDVTHLRDFFTVLVSGDDVSEQKPSAEPVKKALSLLNVPASNAWMVGDTFADVGAGKNAGIRTIGVLYGHQGESIRDCEPDYIVTAIGDVLPIILEE